MKRSLAILLVWLMLVDPLCAVELLKQSSTAQPLTFLMVDSTDHVTGKTGRTCTVTLSKAGGSFAGNHGGAGGVTEIANGWYKVAGDATDTDTLGPLILHATAADSDPTDVKYEIVAFDPQDQVRMGQTAIPNVATGNAGALLVDGTGTAAISTSGGKVLLQATQTGVTIPTVTTVTNQLTAAQIATGVWQDANGTDFNTPSSIGKSLYTSGVAPGGTNGLLIAGSNAATTFASLTSTGAFTIGDGLTISRSTTNGTAITATGNGTGSGANILSGNGAGAFGLHVASNATNGTGVIVEGSGSGQGFRSMGGPTGASVLLNAGDTSGDGLLINTTSGHGINIAAAGTSKHGILTTGGSGGTSDGFKAVAGTGGVPIRGDITGNLGGSVTGTVGGFTASALADMFDTDSGKAYSDAVPGSIVKEIADHATTPSLTAAGIADAVLDELLSGHTTSGSLGKTISDIFAFLDGAPTFGEAMDEHGYTSARAMQIDKLPPTLLVSTTIATLTSQTSFTLAAGPTGDDALNGALVIVTNVAGTQKAVGVVKDYVGSTTLRVTLLTDPEIFTMAVDDTVDVIAGGPIPLWLGASP